MPVDQGCSTMRRCRTGLHGNLRMSRLYRSTQTEAFARGEEFGRAHAERIAASVEGYRTMWRGIQAGHDAFAPGQMALDATRAFAPHLAEEMQGMAKGAGLDPRLIGAAEMSVTAHLLDLEKRGMAARDGDIWRAV